MLGAKRAACMALPSSILSHSDNRTTQCGQENSTIVLHLFGSEALFLLSSKVQKVSMLCFLHFEQPRSHVLLLHLSLNARPGSSPDAASGRTQR